ncbi:helix-turn-helix transcriptional regulator [Aurantibacter crassamenti]|uniref:helix-turn-helix domain-containing protein n=1 Tax=Aurantibacter crassamenti TaxID=1837375 RepID=UPI00193969F1|nr:helix-turn-helix transcriptional regulator [Aurantibacter crassamenti]MBM1107939.1 helix-turn-helix transcriptional regulator [Aurantibacter crassamenti]
MVLDLNLISVLDSAGVIQGIGFGLVLLVINKWKKNNTYLLAIFLILFALQRLDVVFSELNVYEYYPWLYLLPTFSFAIIYPVFFIYTQKVSIFSKKKLKIWLLYPGIIYSMIQLYIFFLPYQEKLVLVEQSWYEFSKVPAILFGLGVALWNIKFISDHQKEVFNQYSMTQFKELKWAKYFLIYSTVGSVLYALQWFLLPENIYSRISFLLFDLLTIYWLSFYGIKQLNVHSIIANLEIPKEQPIVESSDKQFIVNKDLEELFEEIETYMISSQAYTKTELTIVDVAKQLKVHPRRISTAINSIPKQNFNNYVNRFRVEKALALIQNKNLENYSIEGIGSEVGFHSKSAFYAAFKKETGTTPTRYLQKHIA